MMDPLNYTFFLTQVMGIFLFIMAITLIGRVSYYREIVLKLQAKNPIVPTVAYLNVFLGIALVMSHNRWGFDHAMVVTVLCWFIFLKGLLWLVIPEKMLSMMKKVISGKQYYWYIVLILVLSVIFLSRSMQLFMLHHGF